MRYPDLDSFIERNATRGIVVDTNVLLLYFVGNMDRAMVPRFKRTRMFVVEDYDTLRRLLRFFVSVFITPNVMTEISNLGSRLEEPRRNDFFRLIGRTVAALPEKYVSTHVLSGRPEFVRLGVTDTSIVAVAGQLCGVLTDDARLAAELQTSGIDVINFNHVRTFGWR